MLSDYFKGFYLTEAQGNNAFSFQQRTLRQIYIPPFIEGTLDDLAIGEEPVFVEFHDGREIRKCGLKNFVHWPRGNQDIFIFDNHNHAFFLWVYGYQQGWIQAGQLLVHVDQHKDLREPDDFLGTALTDLTLEKAFHYTQQILNVGNFVVPALRLKIFSEAVMVQNEDDFRQAVPDNYVLDVDLDIFAPEMDYINHKLKMSFIQKLISKARLVTMATSPYFIEQERALAILKELFSG